MNWRDIAVHNDTAVLGFFAGFRWLSNFHLCPIQYQGVVYPAVENAYMAAKCIIPEQRKVFVTSSPSQAKKLGQAVQLRSDWEDVKLNIMYELNEQKYANNPDLRERLIATDRKYLEETNYWGDVYWGVCKQEGKNHLGKIIMQVRSELINGSI